MGKTGSWMHSIKKAIRNHVHGDLDRNKFQHLAHDKKPSSDQRTCSTASSHVEHDSHRRPSTSSQVGGSGHHEHSLPKVEKGRSSTSSQVAHHNEKSTTSDKDKRRSSTSSQNGGSGHYEKDDSCQHGSGHHNYVTDHYNRKSSHRSENGSGHHKEESSTPRDRSDRENGSRQHRDDRSSHTEREGRKSSSHHRDEKGNGHRTGEKSSSSHRDERERGKDDYGAGADSSHLQRDERDRYVKLQLHRDGSGEHQHLAKLHREGSGDHQHLVKVYPDERGSGGGGQNPFYEKGRSSTSSERRYGFREESASDRGAPRHSTHSDRGGERSHEEEKGRSSTSSQKERSSSRHGHRDHERDHEKPPVEKGRSSTSTSSTHNERTILEKARSSTSSNHPRDANSSSEKGRPCTPSSPDNRTRSLLISIETPSPSEKRRSSSGAGAASPRHQHQHAGAASPRHHQVIDKASSEKLRPKTTSSPPMVVLGKTQSDKSSSRSAPVPAAGSNSREIPHQQLLEKSHRSTPTPTPSTPQLGRSIALQDLFKPPSFERKSSSSSSMSLSQVGGSMRSFTSEGSISSSDDYVELVFPQAETRPAAAPQVKTTPPPPPPSISASQNHNQRKKVAIATVKEVFSLHEYDVPLSPGAQRRKSASFTPKTLPELGTKSLLPPDYRKQQPALAVADMPAVIFKAGDAGVGGMLGEWAAITIQSSWRGFAARVAFNALKGLVRFQALVRGHLVRRKIAPLIKARIQAARVRIKLNRNPKVHNLHPIHISKSNGYGIAQTVFETRTSSQYGFAQPVLDDSPTITRGHSGPRDTLKAFM